MPAVCVIPWSIASVPTLTFTAPSFSKGTPIGAVVALVVRLTVPELCHSRR